MEQVILTEEDLEGKIGHWFYDPESDLTYQLMAKRDDMYLTWDIDGGAEEFSFESLEGDIHKGTKQPDEGV